MTPEAPLPSEVVFRQGESYGVTPEEIDRLPDLPGVYLMRGADGKVLYVGKAASLRARVRTYFTRGGDGRFNVAFLLRQVRTVEAILTANEKEAILLENILIKREQPRYNILLRDDKTYVSVRIDLNHPWPRAVLMRRRGARPDGALYLGPYDSAVSVRQTLRLLQRVFPIRSCPDHVLRNRSRPCLLHPIGRCCAPCVKPVDPEEYREYVQGTILALRGRTREVIDKLREKMDRHAAALEYEQAAATRDRIAALERTAERQDVHRHEGENWDVIVMRRAAGRIGVTVFVYRNGLLIRSRPFVFRDHNRGEPDLMEEFLIRYYEGETPPGEILLEGLPSGTDVLEEWLSDRHEARCHLHAPQRGLKRRLVRTALRNCALLLEQHLAGRASLEALQAEIARRFHLQQAPDPIECFDVSTIQGFATVASMVTFRRGEPDKSRYRHFRIKSLIGQDDYGALREALVRRFRRAIEAGEALPGLVLIDGGKGQLNVAREVFDELGLNDVGLAAIAKSRPPARAGRPERTQERFFLPGRKNPVTFPAHSAALYLLQRARDEAHRFGLSYHRTLRSRRNLRSSLEELPGVGRTRALRLIRAFGSLRALRDASEAEIAAVRGIPGPVAAVVHGFLHMPATAQTGSREPLQVEQAASGGNGGRDESTP